MGLVVLAFNLLLFATCGYAIWRGGPPEQRIAVAFILAAAATMLLHLPRATEFDNLELGVLAVDAVLMAYLVNIALKANRYWPIWTIGLHAVTLTAHLAKAINPSIVWPVYATAASMASIPMVMILWWGTLRHRRRVKRFGSDPPWKISSNRSADTQPEDGRPN